ncbi:DedA family protein [Mesobacterium sp. TK19101]|uniref:DedA family protein n=1 Tax=Mesobacterium hydrothermale TaxID=3111907 RepID=A0ABU6HHW1_9RHOB|nr:DedA family protein [Mesobacterium sp. TK19101]MEC3862054.1 DedA family protein [Mesobacterium sp. TK19101]
MTDWLFTLVPIYGAWIIALATYLSCLAIPMPSSFLMLAGGAFVASGDLALSSVVLGAFGGAILGDQTGYVLGRKGGNFLARGAKRGGKRRALIVRARAFLDRWGVLSVFLSRWLFSPLGPYINFLGGAGGLRWSGFTLGSLTGESVWVVLYVGLGYTFSGQIAQVAEFAGDIAGLLAGLVVTFGLGAMLLRAARRHDRRVKAKSETA